VPPITRRQFVLLGGVGALAATLPECADRSRSPAAARFFTPEEREAIEAACEAIFPRDDEPGALEIGAAEYIDRFLVAFDVDPPLIYSRGPFSGRSPYPDPATGSPGADSPENEFAEFIPLEPIEELAWRVRLYGSKGVPGGDFNDAVLGETRGLRDIFRDGIRLLEQSARERGSA
jgi:hypothetical protein